MLRSAARVSAGNGSPCESIALPPNGYSVVSTARKTPMGVGCSTDDVTVRVGHDSYWNTHAGFSGTYASQFAVTGLGAVKGTGEGAINHIIEERGRGGPYKDLFDFCHRVDNRIVNRRVVESLVRAGAFDGIDGNRAVLLGLTAEGVLVAPGAIIRLHPEGSIGLDDRGE